MLNRFEGIGNVGSNPTLSTVQVGDELRQVVNMRVYFDRPIGEDFKDKGGFWYSVDIWGYRAEEAIRLLKKGARIFVMGGLRAESWTDNSGEVRSEQRLTADYFFLDSVCIETVQYREKKKANQVSNDQNKQAA